MVQALLALVATYGRYAVLLLSVCRIRDEDNIAVRKDKQAGNISAVRVLLMLFTIL